MAYIRSHVHRNRSQPQLASRHPPARRLARGRQGQETRQPLQMAPDAHRGLARAAQGRRRGVPPRRRTCVPNPTARSCASCDWIGRYAGIDACLPDPGSKLATARGLAEPRLVGAGRLRRTIFTPPLAAQAPGRHRAALGQAASEGRRPGALRPDVGVAGLLARRQARQIADRVRALVRRRGPPGGQVFDGNTADPATVGAQIDKSVRVLRWWATAGC